VITRNKDRVVSTVNAHGMTMFEPKSDTKQVHIWADNDKAGIDAAKKLQEKLLAAGKVKVQVVIPKKQGHDFLDELNTVVFKVTDSMPSATCSNLLFLVGSLTCVLKGR
jgi:maltose-binding protein MalE